MAAHVRDTSSTIQERIATTHVKNLDVDIGAEPFLNIAQECVLVGIGEQADVDLGASGSRDDVDSVACLNHVDLNGVEQVVRDAGKHVSVWLGSLDDLVQLFHHLAKEVALVWGDAFEVLPDRR